jgi:Holliday junction resolvasome RuvABC endonuclease subunit
MTAPRILTIDLATRTGWCIGRDMDDLIFGAEDFSVKRQEGAGMRTHRARKWLNEMLFDLVDFVYLEEVRQHSAVQAAHIYGGLLHAFMEVCEQFKVPYQTVPVGSWKKSLCLNGAAKKDQVMLAVREGLGLDPETQDMADAIGMWYHARYTLNPQVYDLSPLSEFWPRLERAKRHEAQRLAHDAGLSRIPQNPVECLKAWRAKSAP